MTKDVLVNKSKEIYGESAYDFSLVNETFGVKDKTLRIKCLRKDEIHGEHGEFITSYDNFINKRHGCTLCSNRRRYNTEEFIKKARHIHGDKYDYSKVEYSNKSTKVCIICPIHGEFWQTPSNHFKYGCQKCGMERISEKLSISVEKFTELVKDKTREYFYDFDTFVNFKTPMKIKCLKCYKEFWQTPSKHIYDSHGCPFCKESKGEREISNILDNLSLQYIQQYSGDIFKSKNGKLKLDFFVEELSLGIEFQGRQHFTNIENYYFDHEKQVERDIRKYHICQENGIKLIYVVKDKKDVAWNIPIYNCENTMTLTELVDYISELKKKSIMTKDELKDRLLEMGMEDTIFFENPSYVDAIIGISSDDRLIYDYDKMVEFLVENDGMENDEAMEFIDYNTIRALPYMGDKAPIVNLPFNY